MARTLRGEIKPTQAAAFPPLSINVERQETASSPCRELFAAADRQLQTPRVLSNSVCLGFAYADVAEMGTSALAVTDDNPTFAQQLADELAGYLWEHRQQFVGQAVAVDEAIQRAMQLEEPVCLLDTGDNIGGGSPGDGTWLSHALDRSGVARSLVCLVDPAVVSQCEAAGVGKTVRLSIGGRGGPLQGPPFAGEMAILDLCDGDFEEVQPLHGGFAKFDQGRTAVLRTGAGLTLIVTSQRVPPFSLGQITRAGLNPARFRVLVAKGVVAPIAAYRAVCNHFIRVATPGVATTDMAQLRHEHRRRPLFPFETDFDWTPAAGGEPAMR
jgi:microcystin degradation protein MlrC